MNPIFKKVKDLIRPEKKKLEPLDIVQQLGQENQAWWGSTTLKSRQSRFWHIGDTIIFLDRLGDEWHIAHNNAHHLEKELQFATYTFQSEPEVCLFPVLADRSLASKLARPLYVPAGEEVLLYVSSPVWIRVATKKPKLSLSEVPSSILSDTWFGLNTLEGELCYAGKTYCSSDLQELPHGPDRIISPMLIRNRAKTVLPLISISVPLPYLSVYNDPQNHLWTEQLNLQRERGYRAEIKVAKGPPGGTSKLELLAQPRTRLKSGVTFKLLLHSLIGS